MLLLGMMSATERLAVFLLNLAQRFAARGLSSSEFHLRMTRAEIGSYLGVSLETVSRLFSRFHEDRLICVTQKHVRILDHHSLRMTAFPLEDLSSPAVALACPLFHPGAVEDCDVAPAVLGRFAAARDANAGNDAVGDEVQVALELRPPGS